MSLSFYDAHAKEYAALTVKADMSPAYDRFLAYLPAGAAILDAGCGSGRDSLCFMKKGYDVTMLDASGEMCKCAEALTGQKALCMGFHEIEFADRFDGIWACASLLHVSEKELENVLGKRAGNFPSCAETGRRFVCLVEIRGGGTYGRRTILL